MREKVLKQKGGLSLQLQRCWEAGRAAQAGAGPAAGEARGINRGAALVESYRLPGRERIQTVFNLRPIDSLCVSGICSVGLDLLGGFTVGSLGAVLSYLFFKLLPLTVSFFFNLAVNHFTNQLSPANTRALAFSRRICFGRPLATKTMFVSITVC